MALPTTRSTHILGRRTEGNHAQSRPFEVARGKTAVIGNVDPILFMEGTQDQLRKAAKECLDIARKDPGYVVGPGCQIPLEADLDNIKAFTQACHEYGTF